MPAIKLKALLLRFKPITLLFCTFGNNRKLGAIKRFCAFNDWEMD